VQFDETKGYVPVHKELTCDHHRIMLKSFGLLKKVYYDNDNESLPPLNVLVIGLGGGPLTSFLATSMPESIANLTAVEIDPEMVNVAKKFFGLQEMEKVKIVIDDGLKFIQSTESKYNIQLIDVDNKSIKEGLSCPPPEFLEPTNIEAFKAKLDPQCGVLVINLACRNTELKESYQNHIMEHFPFILSYNITGEINTLLFCFPREPETKLPGTELSLTEVTKKSEDSKATNTIKDSTLNRRKKKKKPSSKVVEWTTQDPGNEKKEVKDEVAQTVEKFRILKM